MKDHFLQTVGSAPVDERRNLAREYLQVYLLRLLHETGAHASLAFLGGTALRLLHNLPRFSEDLDFSFHRATGENAAGPFDPESLFRKLKVALEGSGYSVKVKMRPDRTVASAFFRFNSLPFEAGWSTDPRLGLAVKIEIDQRPPGGEEVSTTLIQRFYPIALRHFELGSLFAGKLHALLTRPYTKGRDWYDLVWYLTEKRGLLPNLVLLENALRQTGQSLSATDWRSAVLTRSRLLSWPDVLEDLRPFVIRQSDLEQLKPALIEKLLSEQGA